MVIAAAIAAGWMGTSAARASIWRPHRSPFVYRAAAGTPAVLLTLRRDGDQVLVVDSVTGRVRARRAISGVSGVFVSGPGGTTDSTLTVDLAGGDLDVPGGVSWDGGHGGFNTLAVNGGGPGRDAAVGPHSGTVYAGRTVINYRDIAPVSVSSSTQFTFTAPPSATVINVVAGPLVGGNQSVQINDGGTSQFEALNVANTPQLFVNGGGSTTVSWVYNEPLAIPGMTSINLAGHGGNTGTNTWLVQDTPPGITSTIDSSGSADNLTVVATHGSTNVVAHNAANAFKVGDSGAGYQATGVNSPLTFSAASGGAAYSLLVDNHADTINSHVVTLTANSLSGLAPAAINFTGASSLQFNAGGGPTTSVTVSSLGAAFPASIWNGTNDNVNVQATAAGSTLTVLGNWGGSQVSFGQATNSTQSIFGAVTVHHVAGAMRMFLYDSADATPRAIGINSNSITGLLPGTLSTDDSSATTWMMAGSGGNTITLGSPRTGGITLYAGTGSDVVNVQQTGGSVYVEGNGGADTFNIGNSGSMQAIAGPLQVQNSAGTATANLSDVNDATGRSLAISPHDVTGLALADINLGTCGTCTGSGISQLNVNLGSGADAVTAAPSTNAAYNINAGAPDSGSPADSLAVDVTGTTGSFLIPSSTGPEYAGTWTFSNRQNIQFSRFESLFPLADLNFAVDSPVGVTEHTHRAEAVLINNNGPVDATNVTWVERLAAGEAYDAVNTHLGSCSTSGVTLTCNVGTISSGASFHGTRALTYGEEGQNDSNSIQVTADQGDLTPNIYSKSVFPADGTLTAPTSAADVNATEGSAAAAIQVGTFTDADPAAVAGDYTYSINWGDGSPPASAASVGPPTGPAGGPRTFDVFGHHAYAEEGVSFPVSVKVTDIGGASVTSSFVTVHVQDAPLGGTGKAFTYTPTLAFTSQSLGTFTDGDAAGAIGDYSASIDWGDGSAPGLGTITGGPTFTVKGDHTYNTGTPHTVKVTVADAGGASTLLTATASHWKALDTTGLGITASTGFFSFGESCPSVPNGSGGQAVNYCFVAGDVADTTFHADGPHILQGRVYRVTLAANSGDITGWTQVFDTGAGGDALNGISCQDSGAAGTAKIRCLAVGHKGLMAWCTDDSCGAWSSRSETLATGATLYGVSCAPGGACATVGSGGTALMSPDALDSNGGDTGGWHHVTGIPNVALLAVDCVTAANCIAGGEGQDLFHGAIGGADAPWSGPATSDGSGYVNSISCANANQDSGRCFAATDGGVVVSEDLGVSWHAAGSAPPVLGALGTSALGVGCTNLDGGLDCSAVSYSGSQLLYPRPTSAPNDAWVTESGVTGQELDAVACATNGSGSFCHAFGLNTVLGRTDSG